MRNKNNQHQIEVYFFAQSIYWCIRKYIECIIYQNLVFFSVENRAENLAELTKSIEKDNMRLRKRHQRFQAQDSVLIEGIETPLED